VAHRAVRTEPVRASSAPCGRRDQNVCVIFPVAGPALDHHLPGPRQASFGAFGTGRAALFAWSYGSTAQRGARAPRRGRFAYPRRKPRTFHPRDGPRRERARRVHDRSPGARPAGGDTPHLARSATVKPTS
jgi:hypothetical protein